MVDDTIKLPYNFIITPLSIEHTDKAKMKLNKRISIKLGTRTIKF